MRPPSIQGDPTNAPGSAARLLETEGGGDVGKGASEWRGTWERKWKPLTPRVRGQEGGRARGGAEHLPRVMAGNPRGQGNPKQGLTEGAVGRKEKGSLWRERNAKSLQCSVGTAGPGASLASRRW